MGIRFLKVVTAVKSRRRWRRRGGGMSGSPGDVSENPTTLPSLYLHHSTFSNPSVASPTSQLILQPIFCFSYVTGFSLTSPGEPPMGVGDECGGITENSYSVVSLDML